MSYDHLSIRIFDTQEKKMLYPGDTFNYINWHDHLIYQGIYGDNIIATYNVCVYIPLGKRFIPMLCAEYKDCNNKLIYEHDIIKTPYAEYVIERYKSMFIANYFTDYFTLDDVMTQSKIEISGNIHENLNPLKKEKDNDQRSTKKPKSSKRIKSLFRGCESNGCNRKSIAKIFDCR